MLAASQAACSCSTSAPFVQYEIVVLLSFAGRLRGVGERAAAEHHIDERRLAHIRAAYKCYFGVIVVWESVHGNAAFDKPHGSHHRVTDYLQALSVELLPGGCLSVKACNHASVGPDLAELPDHFSHHVDGRYARARSADQPCCQLESAAHVTSFDPRECERRQKKSARRVPQWFDRWSLSLGGARACEQNGTNGCASVQ